jgi:hypothetical protein
LAEDTLVMDGLFVTIDGMVVVAPTTAVRALPLDKDSSPTTALRALPLDKDSSPTTAIRVLPLDKDSSPTTALRVLPLDKESSELRALPLDKDLSSVAIFVNGKEEAEVRPPDNGITVAACVAERARFKLLSLASVRNENELDNRVFDLPEYSPM